jgi:hypothetical protein
MFPLNLLFGGGIATKIMAGVLLAGLLFTGAKCTYAEHELSNANQQIVVLTKDNATLTVNNATLKANVDKAADANAATVEANRLLLAERAKAQQIIAELSKRGAKSSSDLAAANKKIDDMLKDPKNDGNVAPVLKETLRDLQRRSK